MEAHGIALVTGASRGIGRALALELARRGFDVVATMREPRDGAGLRDEAERAGLRLRATRLDVAEPGSIAMPDGLRVLVNNAGVEAAHLPLEHASAELWRALFETNLFGLVEVTRRALPKLRASGGGVVCNVTSCSILVPMPLFAAYRASKAAVSALGESLRVEVARFGIRVLEVLPGAIATDMFAGSRHVPEAAGCPGYEGLAARVHAAREGSASTATPVAAAAATIADAILDDRAPLRVACDPMGAGILGAWREQDDESLMRPMLDLFAAGRATARDRGDD
jgi:NAD(P)-dependent dehydrogenase (short-subunit alcohol dehydrogenase family)